MSMLELLQGLALLMKLVPALADVVSRALAGSKHPFEGAWVANVPGLADLLEALREGHMSTAAAVKLALGEVGGPQDQLVLALEARTRELPKTGAV